MTTHSSVLAWRIPWTEETGELQYMGWMMMTRKELDTTQRLSTFIFQIMFQFHLMGKEGF